jgi:phosphomannomutase / phosphoglucomutase
VDIDGVRINLDDGWGLIRASNTQPVLVLRFEAETKDRLNEIIAMVQEQLKKYEPVVQFRPEL